MITPELITAIVALLGAITAFIKSHTDKSKIQEQRAESKKNYEERFSLIELRLTQSEKRLDEGNDRFMMLDKRLDEINGTLRELKGMFSLYLKMREEENR